MAAAAEQGPDIDPALLRAVIDRIMPEDADPGATGFGADRYILAILDGDARHLLPAIASGLADVEARAQADHGATFAGIGSVHQDVVLAAFQQQHWFSALCDLTAEGVYADPANGGNKDAAAWRMIGYRHGLPEGPSGPDLRPLPDQLPRINGPSGKDYDVIIVGAGAGGGVAACVLAEAGKRVLLIDRGLQRSYADSGRRDHLRNHRFAHYGHNTGPPLEGNPRVLVAPDGAERITRPNEVEYGNNASAVGSGTFLYGGLAWRFHPDDFAMASRYGVPEGSSLADWPFGYDEMEPWYSRAEWEIGVSGDPTGCSHEPWRSRPYPMPATTRTESTRLLLDGAARLGIETFAVPILLNTKPRDNRGKCIECGSCVGFPCPSNAKNGTANTVIPRALATGRCTLWTNVTVSRVETDAAGKVTGVTCVEEEADGAISTRRIRAKAVVLAAGAIETARLLLMSTSANQPDGLGNQSGLVGRNLQAHLYPTVFGRFNEVVHDSRGPGVTIASTAYNTAIQGSSAAPCLPTIS